MNQPGAALEEEYVEARRVLLDALEALGPQRDAVIVAGAQAIYLRAGPGSLPIADFTTDGDLALDPALLTDAPTLGDLIDVKIPIDLIVPKGVAAPGGTRGARLGPHGKRAARKTAGLEAVLVDNEVMRIEALDTADTRSSEVKVAGIAALLVAKTHKLNDRVESHRQDRLDDKDASDVVRLMQTSSATQVAKTLSDLVTHPTAGAPTGLAIQHFQALFGTRGGAGIEMAAQALRLAMPEDRVRTICLAYANELRSALQTAGVNL